MIEYYLGIDSDYVVVGLAGLLFLLIIIMLINGFRNRKLRKAYLAFMQGNDGRSLEDTLIERLNQVDKLIESNAANERDIDTLYKKSKKSFCKFGLVKYDALQEMGGKLSFSLCSLNDKDNGYILNVVHSREGCYSYVKEIIGGNSIVTLAEEEQQALLAALNEE